MSGDTGNNGVTSKRLNAPRRSNFFIEEEALAKLARLAAQWGLTNAKGEPNMSAALRRLISEAREGS